MRNAYSHILGVLKHNSHVSFELVSGTKHDKVIITYKNNKRTLIVCRTKKDSRSLKNNYSDLKKLFKVIDAPFKEWKKMP